MMMRWKDSSGYGQTWVLAADGLERTVYAMLLRLLIRYLIHLGIFDKNKLNSNTPPHTPTP
jgi:hypothetical protein